MRNYSEDASKQYHTQVGVGDVGRYVLMPGDPKRCRLIAQYLEDPRLIADSREYVTYTGTLEGVKVSVTSTGIGGPSAAIAMEELSLCGADTFVRVGTCGGMQPMIRSGDIVIATGAIRMEGTSREYAPIEFPAVSSLQVTEALTAAAKKLGYIKPSPESLADPSHQPGRHVFSSAVDAAGRMSAEDGQAKAFHTGVVQCKDSFFGQHDPENMPVGYMLRRKWEAWKKLGCLASEMESAAMFIVAAKLGARAGTCLYVVANQEREKLGLYNPVVHDTDGAIRVAVEAVRSMIHTDRGDSWEVVQWRKADG